MVSTLNFSSAREQRRQVEHVGGDDIGFVFADDFIDVIAIGREIEKHDFVAGVDHLPRRMGADQSGAGDENVHGDCLLGTFRNDGLLT